MHGILYLDKAPKLAVALPIAAAKAKEKTKHINIRGSENGNAKNFLTPLLNINPTVNDKNISDSIAESKMIGELTSQGKGR